MAPNTKAFPQVPLKDMDGTMLIFQLGHWAQKFANEYSIIGQKGADAIASAMEVAAFLHSGQVRRNRANMPVTPYIEHPLRVALRIARWGFNFSNMIVAAILHDVLEDCKEKIEEHFCEDDQTAYDWIRESYGIGVALTVDAVTNHYQPYAEKIEELCENAIQTGDCSAIVVKSGDMVDNAGSLHHQLDGTPERYAKYLRLAKKYNKPLIIMTETLDELSDAHHSVTMANALTNAADRLRTARETMLRHFPEAI